MAISHSKSAGRAALYVISWPLRHWRGDLPLGLVFWVNVVGIATASYLLTPVLALRWGLAGGETAAQFTGLLLLRIFETALLPCWQLVGLWRTSERALRRGRPLRAWCTQVLAVPLTLFVMARGLTVGAELAIGARLAWALGPYAYEVRVLPGEREIEISGGFGFGVADRVAALLREHPQVRRIRLNSGGGALSEAQRLRQVIRKHKLDTITTEVCSSACVSAFMGGRFRYLVRGATMGVHLPRNWQTFSTAPVHGPMAAELALLRRAGLPDWFIAGWIATGTRFWYPGEELLRRAGIVTTVLGSPDTR